MINWWGSYYDPTLPLGVSLYELGIEEQTPVLVDNNKDEYDEEYWDDWWN